jgi:hypothetical protein
LKKIRNSSSHPVIIRYSTLSPGEEMPVLDEDLFDSVEVKTLIERGEIEVINATPPDERSDESV